MRRTMAIVLVVATVAIAAQAQVQITNFTQNGELTWTSPSGSVCNVEWASSIGPVAIWKRHWADLSDIRCTSQQTTAQVPMFYRVSCWTNGLFLSLPIGRTYIYRVTATNRVVTTNEMSCIGLVEGPLFTNGSHAALVTSQRIPDSGGELLTFASSDQTVWMVLANRTVTKKWQAGPVGMTWTNAPDSDGDVMAVRIEAKEPVTVPAGTFDNCIPVSYTHLTLPTIYSV